jgi:hypothetical protein
MPSRRQSRALALLLLAATLALSTSAARAGPEDDDEEARPDFDRAPIASEPGPEIERLSKVPFSELWTNPPAEPKPGEFALTCYRLAGSDSAIAASQKLLVRAPLAEIGAVLERIGEYDRIFRGFKKIKVVEQRGSKILSYWEQRIPIPLVPNVKYRMLYELSSQPGERLLRYRLTWSNTLKFSEGFIRLQQDPGNPNLTRYAEVDVWDSHTGLGGLIAPGRIVRESFEGVAQTDLALLLRAENPTKSVDWVLSESASRVPEHAIERCIEARTEFLSLRAR